MRSDKKRAVVFYGWWVIGACFLMALYSAGAIGYSFTAFIEPIAKEFGWSYANISFASSLRGVEAGLLAPFVGYLVDRFGARPVLFAGGIITGLGVLVLGHVRSIGMFYAAFGLIALGLSASSNTSMIAAVALWFRRNASMAMGIMISGWGFAGFMVPMVVRMVDTLGWRQALDSLGIGMFIVFLPLSLLVKRPSGKDLALINGNGSAGRASLHDGTSISEEMNLSGMQALKSRAFWHISLAMMAQHLVANAVTTHVMPFLSSVGIARSMASLAATGIPVASILGRFGFGWLGDRMNKKWLTAGGFVMLCLGLIIFTYSNPNVLFLLLIFDIFFGIGFGGTNTMRAVLARDCFGSKNFATILGFVTGVGTVGSLVGAPLAGYVYDRMKTYQPVWVGFSLIALICLITIVTLPPVKVGTPRSKEPAEVAGSRK